MKNHLHPLTVLVLALVILAGPTYSASLSTTSGAYVIVPHSESLSITTNKLTVECWFNRQIEVADWSSLVSKQQNSTAFSGYDLRFANNLIVAGIDLDPHSVWQSRIENKIYVPLSIATNSWHHYAMQYDGTNYLVWMDGQVIFSTNCTAQIAVGSNPLHIGCQNSGFRPFKGLITEVRISKSPRYQGSFIPQFRFAADENTVALYHFDEGQGTNVVDSSGNGNHGVVQGANAWSAKLPHNPSLKTGQGTVVAWGAGGLGQSGHPHYGQTTVPAGLSGVVAIAAGDYHTVALKSNGTVVAWGDNYYGQRTVPAGLSGVTAIAAGGHHTVALKLD